MIYNGAINHVLECAIALLGHTEPSEGTIDQRNCAIVVLVFADSYNIITIVHYDNADICHKISRLLGSIFYPFFHFGSGVSYFV